MSRLRVLNLYAGIGGNRALWPDDVSVTAVEYDEAIAGVYSSRFPDDEVVVGDAHEFLEQNYQRFDCVWASPPCQSHGQYRHRVGVLGKGFAPIMPDMKLYSEVVFLQHYFSGAWVVENVQPYYTPLIEPTAVLQRHLLWSNFDIGELTVPPSNIGTKNKISDFEDSELVVGTSIKNKRQVLRNCVDSRLGLHVFSAMMSSMEA